MVSFIGVAHSIFRGPSIRWHDVIVMLVCFGLTGHAIAASTAQCRSGLVWREAFAGDLVCVSPEVRDRTADENAEAAKHIAYCKPGLVQRRATQGDLVCVTPAAHDAAVAENSASLRRTNLLCARISEDRSHCPSPANCLSGFEHRLATSTDNVCAPPSSHARVAQENIAGQGNRNDGPTCENGFVWRLARPSDLVCVLPSSRNDTAQANRDAQKNIEPRVAGCSDYATQAVKQAAEYFARGCGPASNRWQTNWQNHFDFCMGPQGNIVNKEQRERSGLLSQCSTINPLPSHSAGAGATCVVSVLLHNATCLNQNGSPSEYFPAGSYSVWGCGSDEKDALANAKSTASSQLTFVEQPANGVCTYKKETYQGCYCR